MTTKVLFQVEGSSKGDEFTKITIIAKMVIARTDEQNNTIISSENAIRKLGRSFETVEKITVFDAQNKVLAIATATRDHYAIVKGAPSSKNAPVTHARSQTLNAYAKKQEYKPKENEKITDTYRDMGPDLSSVSNFILVLLDIKHKNVSKAKENDAKMTALLAQIAQLQDALKKATAKK
jgi:hypothetical protein